MSACAKRTSVFVEVDQVSLNGQITRIFTGWMFADSPALNAIDHAVYDIWLDDCKQSTDVPPPRSRGTTWWTSHQRACDSQPFHAHPRSRATTARRITPL